MKVVLLAGGFGTRISEESQYKPKPMIDIGGMPILWHIMKGYGYYGYTDFIICAGYMQHVIKEWFADYFLHTSDITFDFTQGNKMIIHNQHAEPWRVTVVDTGLHTMTGGRIKRIQPYVGDETFMLTYGDGVCVHSFREKSINDGAPINAGFMVLESQVFDYLDGDDTVFEREPLERLAAEGQLMSYSHEGFWQCMDTQREKIMLEKLWKNGNAPWKVWKD